MKKIIICAIDRESVKDLLEFVNYDVEVIGYVLKTNSREEIYNWVDSFQENYNIFKDKKTTMKEHIQTLNILVRNLLQDFPETIHMPDMVLGSLSYDIEKIISIIKMSSYHVTEQEELEEIIDKIDKVFENVLEYVYSTYKLVKLSPMKRIELEELKLWDVDDIIIYNGDGWDIWLREKEKVLFFDDLLNFYWGISPERYYLLQNFEEENKGDILGLVTGMSYTQRGINTKRLKKKTSCIGAPSQDLYYDYLMCKFAGEQCENIEFCIIGISPYSLWYDMSLSKSTSSRALYYYEQTKSLHNLKGKEVYQKVYENGREIYEEILHEDMIKRIFDRLRRKHHLYEEKDLFICREEKSKEEIIREIKELFNKPYEKTYLENVEILREFFEYLKGKGITPIVLIPPFPSIFLQNMSDDMLKETIKVIENFKEKYDFIFLNFIKDKRFEDIYFSDYSHLNYFGSNLMADILNSVI